jgi:hypothetical protein
MKPARVVEKLVEKRLLGVPEPSVSCPREVVRKSASRPPLGQSLARLMPSSPVSAFPGLTAAEFQDGCEALAARLPAGIAPGSSVTVLRGADLQGADPLRQSPGTVLRISIAKRISANTNPPAVDPDLNTDRPDCVEEDDAVGAPARSLACH